MDYRLDSTTVRHLLPYGHPMLLVDRVSSYDPETEELTAIKKVTHSDPFLRGHFPDAPIFPGVLIIKALSQACMLVMRLNELGAGRDRAVSEIADHVTNGYEPPQSILVENRVKHKSPLFPGDEMRLEATKDGAEGDVVAFTVRALDANHTVAGKGSLRIHRSVRALTDRPELT